MKDNQINWGILSTAHIAETQVMPAISRSYNGELAAIASSNTEKREEIAKNFNIEKQYDTYEALLADPDIDAVYIPLPNSLHKDWTIKAAEAGKHILCEKPASINIEETKAMFDTSEANDVLLMEAFMYQFHPQHQRVRDIIASGEIGDVRLMKATFTFNIGDPHADNIRLKKDLGGGSLFDVGCYCIHSIRNLLQSEPTELFVQGHIDSETDVELSAQGTMTLANGARAMFDSSFESHPRDKYDIVGTKGIIEVERAYRPDVLPEAEGRIRITTEEGVRDESTYGDQYVFEVEHLAQCILEGQKPSYTRENTLQNMKVIDACYDSLRKGQPVTL